MLTWELKCPHCGGPNTVAADRSCLACQYCGAGLWIELPSGHTTLAAQAGLKRREAVFAWDRSLKEAREPLSSSPRDARLLYLPFWQVSAVVAMRVSPERNASDRENEWGTFDGEGYVPPTRDRTREQSDALLGDWTIKPWETSVAAYPEGLSHLDSLGRRAETAPLTGWDRIVEMDQTVRCGPWLSGEQAVTRLAPSIESVLGMTGRKVEEQRVIAPHLSLIYWPVWQLAERKGDEPRAVEIDAVNGRILAVFPGPLPGVSGDSTPPGASPSLLPHRCPACGADLPVDDRFIVFVCSNCQGLTARDESGHRLTVEADFTAASDRRGVQWYPFWSFDGGGVLVPAFGIRNQRHRLRLGVIMSGSRRATRRPEIPPAGLVGVSLGPEVAAGLAQIIRVRGLRNSPSQSMKPDTTSAGSSVPRLVYAPMHAEGGELVDPVTGLCVSANVVAAT